MKTQADTVLHFLSLVLFLEYLRRLWLSPNTSTKVTVTFFIAMYLRYSLITLVSCCNALISWKVTNPPFIDRNEYDMYFPNHVHFEKQQTFQQIQQEIKQLIEIKPFACFDESVSEIRRIVQKTKDGRCWRWQFIKERGKLKTDTLDNCPMLLKLLQDPIVANASISVLDPEVSIPPHKGYFKGYIRYHICIETPDNDSDKPYIICGGQKYAWKTGESIMFDDMFEHEVVNRSKSRRIVLFLDILRQDMPHGLQQCTNILTNWINENPFLNAVIDNQHITKPL